MAIRSKLAVILHADVVGSTALVHRDERVAHERMRDAFHRFSGTISLYSGITRELRGDALVAQFDRASDAVSAALGFQADNEQMNATLDDGIQPRVRVGIALGEVIIADETVTGAGVVLAQRVEQLAGPGGVCISAAVREALPPRLPLEFGSRGEQKLKGFDEPVRVFAVSLADEGSLPAPEPMAVPGAGRGHRLDTGRPWVRAALVPGLIAAVAVAVWLGVWRPHLDRAEPTFPTASHPEQPSVAVLPFADDSRDEAQASFADGVTEDIITDLSKISGLFVVARNSTFEYRGSAVPLRQIARDLGVRYVLEGSVRRSGERIRVTAQLLDALQGNHLWAERYDRGLQDVFAVQSEVAAQVVKALAVTLKSGELERLFQKYTASIDAYDVFIRARRMVDVPSESNIERGEVLFKKVIELDPGFAGGYAGLAFNYSVKARFGYGTSRTSATQRSLELAQEAIRVDPEFAWSYVALGGALLAHGDAPAAVDTMRQALHLLPGDYEVHLFTGLYLQFAGEAAEAIKHLELARRLNPVDSDRNLAFLGMAYFMNKDYVKAQEYWTRRLRKFPAGSPLALVFMAATHSLQGNPAAAAEAAATLRETFPGFELGRWGWSLAYSKSENRDRLHRGARNAGVP